MKKEVTTKSLDDLTDEELDRLLEEREKKKRREAEARRKKYENDRDSLVHDLTIAAEQIEQQLEQFKTDAYNRISQFSDRMMQYGEINGKSRGGFSIRSADGTRKVTFSQQVRKVFDERAEMAEQKIREFIAKFIKKRDEKAYDLIMSLLERNSKTGDFEVNSINKLYKMEDKFDDELWKDGIRLFKESYNPQKTTKYINFYKLSATEKEELINLNFSSARIREGGAL
jgi:hypothetical protein